MHYVCTWNYFVDQCTDGIISMPVNSCATFTPTTNRANPLMRPLEVYIKYFLRGYVFQEKTKIYLFSAYH